jgi:hypothetical protein
MCCTLLNKDNKASFGPENQSCIKNRLNIRNLLRRKTMPLESYDCELCLLIKEEKLRHLFFKCPFARNCWSQIGINPPTWLKPDRTTRNIKRALRVPFPIDIIILMCWGIWHERNAWIFSFEDPPGGKMLGNLQERICSCYTQSKAKLVCRYEIMAKWCLSFSALFSPFSVFVLLSFSFETGDPFIMFNKKYQ